jgi:hypothetical protein
LLLEKVFVRDPLSRMAGKDTAICNDKEKPTLTGTMTRLDWFVMLLGGLVGVGRGRGEARQRARQGDNRRDVRSVSSIHVKSHNVEMRAIQAGAGTEGARLPEKGSSAGPRHRMM